jgi:hypothetical protein
MRNHRSSLHELNYHNEDRFASMSYDHQIHIARASEIFYSYERQKIWHGWQNGITNHKGLVQTKIERNTSSLLVLDVLKV